MLVKMSFQLEPMDHKNLLILSVKVEHDNHLKKEFRQSHTLQINLCIQKYKK